jgi:hypothetical protein
MALPKLNSAPKYQITVPSTGQEVRYRPYLVKEEKILMLAMESQDQGSALSAIVDTIESCVTDINTKELTTFDVEYLFTQIRSKSVGETAKVGVGCKHCDATNEVVIKLDDISVTIPDNLSKNIQLTDDISLLMRWPSYKEVTSMDTNQTDTETTFSLIASCIDSVQTGDESIRLRDETAKEVSEFVESLSSTQFDLIKGYVEQMPKMEHSVSFECVSCKKVSDVTLSGISDFF